MKRIIQSMLVACFFLTLKASAQNETDVLRYSMINYGSTARSLGMGNAFAALGADLSVIATNPAGIAVFRRSEFSFSPTFTLKKTESEFLGKKTSDSKFNFNFGNFGAVWHWNQKDETKEWKGWSFGIGYNRLNDFSSNSVAEGTNPNNSLLDSYVEQANGNIDSTLSDAFPFDVGLAYNTYLVNPTDSPAIHYASVIPHGGEYQRRKTSTRGGQGEWDFSFGTNYNDQLFFGVTLGVSSINYREDVTWDEVDQDNKIVSADSAFDFKSFKYTQSLKTTGSGVNGKFGIIYRPGDLIRLGLAIHTPTAYLLTDEFSTNISAKFDNTPYPNQEATSPVFVPFEYRLVTPFHAIGSAAAVLGKQGVISAEYEFTDYSQSSLKVTDPTIEVSFSDVNTTIKNKYTASHTIRLGGEYRYDKMRLRLGGSYSTTPFASGYNDNSKTDQSRYSVTGGFGFRGDNFYFDAAYAYSHKGSFFNQYTINKVPQGSITENLVDNRLMFTLGFNF